MKRIIRTLSVFAVFFCLLLGSCSDDGDQPPPNLLYDLRPLTRVFEWFESPAENPNSPASFHRRAKRPSIPSGKRFAPQLSVATALESDSVEQILTLAYGTNAHLFWTKASGTDAQGQLVTTASQALDDAGFPTRSLWYDGEGVFQHAYDYTYDSRLYLKTSAICYLDDPTSDPYARKDYEFESQWNEKGILAVRSGVEYDSNGVKQSEYKWRSTTLENALRGAGGLGFDEYYREYKEGTLVYQEAVTFNRDGYPDTFSVDSNGDGTFEETYFSTITKTPQGYLESLTWVEADTDINSWKTTFSYDDEGLLEKTRDYEWVEDQFVLKGIVTDIWYRNPVNGPTGGINVYFESDEQGNPVGEYEIIEWSETSLIRHYRASPETEIARVTESLEKIRLQ